ncbi:WD40-repeat-containing domain protein [Catenaria anguillulae PL171]|uniref:Peroxin-7 n=1 Tax=Catenaria anguillulae PL171 TaxID=765915 RepID=A0A1Y2H7C4_9FUNG|nr:WD40-repeat-containing domain protein [Catenaria anguillulae PL171]
MNTPLSAHRPRPTPMSGPHPASSLALPAGFQGYAVEHSPFFDSRLAIASAANFGIVGNGRLSVVENYAHIARSYDSQDGMFALAWSEVHEAQIVTGCGDGSIKLWDLNVGSQFPVVNWAPAINGGHEREVFSVHWNQVDKSTFATASWDRTIKIWSPANSSSPLVTLSGHSDCVYSAIHSPRSQNLLASGSADRTLRLWDTRTGNALLAHLGAHHHDVLSLDWDKYSDHLLYTASADRDIKVWDTRQLGPGCVPLITIPDAGSRFPVRRIKACPHKCGRIASVGYDMCAKVWDVNLAVAAGVPGTVGVPGAAQMVWMSDAHTEFAMGVDWSLFAPGRLVTTGWDGFLYAHQVPM